MPDGWTFNAPAFLDGASFAVYVGLATLAVLVVISGVRRVLSI